jgi:hypothetical protein
MFPSLLRFVEKPALYATNKKMTPQIAVAAKNPVIYANRIWDWFDFGLSELFSIMCLA